jgi:hypothetical protein
VKPDHPIHPACETIRALALLLLVIHTTQSPFWAVVALALATAGMVEIRELLSVLVGPRRPSRRPRPMRRRSQRGRSLEQGRSRSAESVD